MLCCCQQCCISHFLSIYIYIYINTSSSLSTTFASACDKNINKYKVDLTYIHIVRTPSIPLPYGTMIMRASSCAGNSLSMCMYIYICRWHVHYFLLLQSTAQNCLAGQHCHSGSAPWIWCRRDKIKINKYLISTYLMHVNINMCVYIYIHVNDCQPTRIETIIHTTLSSGGPHCNFWQL